MSRRAALILAAAVFLFDQATKLLMLHGLRLEEGRVAVLPFMEFVLVWNRGISYGLFQQDDALGRWLLVAFTLAATGALAVWLARAARGLVRLGLALIVGGALGNLVDRVVYGAVVDFVHLFAGDFSWYVFNVADAAIVAGVAVLLVDSIRPTRRATDGTQP